ncbi:membrane protein GlpM [Clostridium zeae]|uniref:Membrane protein GlpM n=1 Tax=Clostridium zeae TaxID=2759022 RepID=A0ABQ1E659_9CLOT|nr:GlpM family protein [Clostridium zeae]GFZ30252.1 membrane protein GlpM [Clostridium zeae]
MNLLIKCIVAVIIMIAVHFISKSHNYYIAGLVLSFPGLSILAYYFMYKEQGASKVRVTTHFAMLSAIPFVMFLFALNYALKKYDIFNSILISSIVWIVFSSILIIIWKNLNIV